MHTKSLVVDEQSNKCRDDINSMKFSFFLLALCNQCNAFLSSRLHVFQAVNGMPRVYHRYKNPFPVNHYLRVTDSEEVHSDNPEDNASMVDPVFSDDEMLESQARQWIRGDANRQAWWDKMQKSKLEMQKSQKLRMDSVTEELNTLVLYLKNIESLTGLNLVERSKNSRQKIKLTASGLALVIFSTLFPIWTVWKFISILFDVDAHNSVRF